MSEYPTVPPEASHVIGNRIMPVREVHLLGGPSGGSKTTIAATMLDAVSKGLPVFGHPTTKMRCGYVAADRSLESVRATLQRIGLTLDGIPMLSLVDMPSIQDPQQAIERLGVRAGFVLLDAVGTFLPSARMNDYRSVADFLRTLARLCQARDVTILGTTHSSKMRTDARYEIAREQLIGSAAWSAFSGTVMVVQHVNPKEVCDRRRKFYLLPRNARPSQYELTLDEQGRVPGIVANGAEYLDFCLNQMSVGDGVSTQTLLAWGREAGLAERTVEMWIRSMCGPGGKLVRERRGQYTVALRPFSMENDALSGRSGAGDRGVGVANAPESLLCVLVSIK
jgi:hypothetical protein